MKPKYTILAFFHKEILVNTGASAWYGLLVRLPGEAGENRSGLIDFVLHLFI